jgi:hypothetical protein
MITSLEIGKLRIENHKFDLFATQTYLTIL